MKDVTFKSTERFAPIALALCQQTAKLFGVMLATVPLDSLRFGERQKLRRLLSRVVGAAAGTLAALVQQDSAGSG